MASPNDLLPENRSINAPREIMRLVNWMMACTLNSVFFIHLRVRLRLLRVKQDALFFSPADEAIVNTI